MLTQEDIKKIAHYDPETGIFTALGKRRGKKTKNWPTLGSTNGLGYLQMKVGVEAFKLHRLAWLYMTGSFPAKALDHADTDRKNNKWANLREATQDENLHNTKNYKTNTTGAKGVSWKKDRKKYSARINVANKSVFLGYFSSVAAAHAAYAEEARRRFGDFGRTA